MYDKLNRCMLSKSYCIVLYYTQTRNNESERRVNVRFDVMRQVSVLFLHLCVNSKFFVCYLRYITQTAAISSEIQIYIDLYVEI